MNFDICKQHLDFSSWPKQVKVFTDGASRGNPGLSSFGIIFLDASDSDKPLLEVGHKMGTATNNQAEYQAIYEALKIAGQASQCQFSFFADSEFAVKQLNGIYKIKNPNIKETALACIKLAGSMKVSFSHVRREANAVADGLANEALDLG